ncbi:MAG: transcription elongation factor GreA, partial [Candidatus Limnocylindrales bacterium]
VRNRVAAQAATALGDRRPFAGGYWLKTLRGLEQARVWWAATDAPEEYADALLDAFAARLGRPAVLPFANLDASGARRRQHGLSGALLADPAGGGTLRGVGATAAARSTSGDRSRPAARSGSWARATSGARRPTPARVPLSGPADPGPRARRSRSTPPSKRAAEPAYLSAEGLERIRAELAELRDVQRPQVIARVRSARELGDLKENSEYHAAREEQSFLEGRVLQLQDLVDRAVLVAGGEAGGLVAIGSTVEVVADEDPAAQPLTLTIVGTAEADSRAGRVSDRSPMGAALIGRQAGAAVTVRTPGGERRYTIRSVR